jgi:diguanylate cyclase (GGDEF)-like protein/PAS domain S-box-containing protein
MSFNRFINAAPSFWLTAAMLLALALSFGLYVRAENKTDRATEQRLSSFVLATQLRQSSDDLTRMVRSYAVTSDPRYKKYYQDILAIREGKKPRPEGYFRSYWNIVLADANYQQAGGGQSVSLLDLMHQAGFADDEFGKLAGAKANSDELTAIELKAMSLVELGGPEAEANRSKALLMLYGTPYLQAKAAIVRPINAAFELMDKRTSEQIDASERMAAIFRAIFFLCILVTILMLWRAYAAIRKTLGGSAQEVREHIERIGRGELSSPIAVTPGMEESVLAELLSMQIHLRTSQSRQNALFAASPDAILISDAQGVITQANQQVESLFGYTAEELIGQAIEVLVPESLRAEHPKRRTTFADSPTIRRMGHGMEVKALRKDGNQVDVEVSLSRIETDQSIFFVSAVHDISERKQDEDRIRKLNHLYAALSHCNKAIVRCTGVEELFPKICHDVVAFGGMKLAWIGMVDESSQRITPVASYGAAQDFLDSIQISIANDSHGQGAGAVVRDDQPLWFQDYLHDDRTAPWQDAAKRFGLASAASLPLHRDGKVVGVFTLYAAEINAFDEDTRTLLLEMEVDISFALDNFAREVARKAAEKTLQDNVEQLRIAATVFESQEAMLITDSNSVILSVNRAFTEITGYAREEAIGQTPRLLKSDRHSAAFYREMWESLHRIGVWQGEVWDRRKNGEVYPKWLTISAVKNASGTVTHYVGTHFDITERKKDEAKIEELAFFDQLTGLPNRTLLLDRLRQAMTVSERTGSFGALLLLDLDKFKTLNDTLGHEMGDELLKQVAKRLATCVRAGDTVARLGGDEFLVMLANLSVSEVDAANQAEAVADKVMAALNQTYQLGDVAYLSTPSIGVTLFRDHLTSIDDLTKQADLAMYKAKAAGRNLIRFFDPAMEIAVMERAALDKDLRQALQEKQFLLHYQPQIAGDSQLTGAEVLVRWQHPQRGMVSPADFIPMAEETGLILPLGHWVLETACAQLARWATRPGMEHLTLAVNVSAHQFREPDFVAKVQKVVAQTGANPRRLKLELTESMLVDNVDDIIAKMFMLKASGIGFSLDDFGTGYSSLSYLKRLPLDQLKIDQSFVRDVLSDPNDAAIARTVVALAQSLGLGVIAEGVETEAQKDFLASSGCHAYQGYFFSRPLPLADFEQFARQA